MLRLVLAYLVELGNHRLVIALRQLLAITHDALVEGVGPFSCSLLGKSLHCAIRHGFQAWTLVFYGHGINIIDLH